MFECLCCGCRFDEPVEYTEQDEYWGARFSFIETGCPVCHGSYAEIETEVEYEE